MQPQSDAWLLREYAEHGKESAFAELTARHTNLVYSAVLRQMDSPDLAAEVTQQAFIGLARGALALSKRLAEDASLAGWLCRSARNLSLNLRRDEFRRHSRERQAMAQHDSTPETSPDWEQLRPVMDEAMAELSETDYDAIVLRFYQQQDLRSVGRALGLSDDAAQKRVSRAMEQLRESFAERGFTLGAVGLTAVISANAVQAAPVGLAVAVSAAALAGTTLASATATATKAIAMTVLQKAIICATVAVLAGTGFYEARQAANARAEARTLQQQQGPLTEQIQQLQHQGDEAARQLAFLHEENKRLNGATVELLRLRAEVGALRSNSSASQERGTGMQIQGRPLASWLADVNIERGLLEADPALDVLVSAGPTVLTHLAEILQHDLSTTQQAKAADVIGAIAHRNPAAPEIPGVIPALSSAADNQDARVRRVAVQALGSVGRAASNAIPVLSRRAKDEDESMRKCAVEALRLIGMPTSQALEALHGSLSDPDGTVQIFAVQALYELGQPATNAVPLLIQLSKNTDVGVRCSAIQTLGRVGTNHPEAVVALRSALNDESETFVRPLAREALKKLEANGGL